MRVTTKGQVTIPKYIREDLGINPETEIDFIRDNGRYYIVKSKEAKKKGKFDKFRGISKAKMTTDEIMSLTRDKIMNGVLVDSCVLLDLITDYENWAEWSENILERYNQTNSLYINSIIYAEISINFDKIEELDNMLDELEIKVIEIPREALFLAGKAFLKYKRNKGVKTSPLPDFYIGAHALVSQFDLITRDLRRFKQHFARVKLIFP